MVPVAKRLGRPRNRKLAALVDKPPGDLWLPSLARKELSGHAFRYTIVLPLLSGSGEEVFSVQQHIPDLIRLLNARFKGCTTSGDRPAYIGYWVPGAGGDSGKDRSTSLMVYSRVSDDVDEFFGHLKTALKEIGRQEEILIERADVWLTPAARTR
ncbi:MAG: hypothetical protein ACREHD_31100 [Pirellulales bacterium]